MDQLRASEAANRRVVGQLNSQVYTGGDVVCIGRATMRMRESTVCTGGYTVYTGSDRFRVRPK